MGAKNEFSFLENSYVTKIGKKNTFQKEFFNKTWLKVGEHEYIFLCGITFKEVILFKNDGQTRFCNIVQ